MMSSKPIQAARQVQVYLQGADLMGATIERVAEDLGTPQTTMTRRLRRGGTTFQKLKDEERRRRLHQLVRRGQIVPKRDLEYLGFREPNTFYRFFREHMGMGVREHKNREKSKMKLPADNYEVLEMVKSLLRNADLTDCKRRTVEEVIGAPFPTIRHRLTQLGTTWEVLKTQERVRRMEQLINSPGRFDPVAAAEVVGFREVGSFYRFFQEQMGMTYTDWRTQRQAA